MKTTKFLALLIIISNFNLIEMVTTNGALIATYFDGEVGYNLDEIPSSAMTKAKNYISTQVTDEQWLERAKMQITATIYRQIFRVYYFGPNLQLTLPPSDVWQINFTI